jgi:hypothetical protein
MRPLFAPVIQMSAAFLYRNKDSSRTLRQSILKPVDAKPLALPKAKVKRLKPPKAFTTLSEHIKAKTQKKSRLEAFLPLRNRLTKIYRRPVFLQSNRLVAL